MEFIDFLDREELEIISIVNKAGYKTEENDPLCLLSERYVGFLKKRQKTIIICTDNIKKKGGYKIPRKMRTKSEFEKTALHMKKALRHEAVHVAQECNQGKVLNIGKRLSMNPAKNEALKGSTKISGEEEKERQAYILEDKPKLVKRELEKYCL